MINYLSAFANTNGLSFPDTLGVNASGGGALDGTEWVKLFIDDQWGARQALMDHAGLTPDSVTEAPGTAQTLEALRKGFGIGAGVGVIYWKNDDPATNGDRIILLNGQGIIRANFADLDSAVYVGDGNNATAEAYYHADDAGGAARNTVGIYLILPETRGYTLRGLDVAASVDPQGASRTLGGVQDDAAQRIEGRFQAHLHRTPTVALIGGYVGVFSPSNSASQFYVTNVSSPAGSATVQTDFDNANSVTPNASKTDDVETRMSNVTTRYGITY